MAGGRAVTRLSGLKSTDRLLGIVLAILALVVLVELRNSSDLEFWDLNGPGPAFLPAALAVILLLLAGSLVMSSSQHAPAMVGVSGSATAKYVLLAAVLAYLFPVLGGLPSMGLFVFVEALWVEGRDWGRAVLASVLTVAAVWLVFSRLLNVVFPVGLLGV